MKISISDIAGTVILYNSSIETINNIKTYVNQVQKLYVVDNSTEPNQELIKNLNENYKNIYYHSLKGNKGIAVALNWSATQAIKDGFKLLLTMDDDTQVSETMVKEMIAFWNIYPNLIGILSGIHQIDYNKYVLKRFKNKAYLELPYKETSGNILNLMAYKVVGAFSDQLFIDHVDHEYGFRLNIHGYKVIELKDIRLNHRLGYDQEIKLGKQKIAKYGTHPPIRLYYYARNGVHIARSYFKEYPSFSWLLIKELSKRWIKSLFLDKDRYKRICMLVYGIADGWKGRLGEYKVR